MRKRPRVRRPSLYTGSLDLVYRQSSPQTGGHSSLRNCGRLCISLTARVSTGQRRTIPSRMGLWNDFIVIWNLRWWLVSQALIGSMNYHGFCSVSAPYPKRTSDVHRRRWCMERHWLFRAISCHVVRTQTMLRTSYLDFARQFASWHLVLPFHMVRNRHLCQLRSPTAVSCSSGETVTYKVLVHGDKSFVLDYGTRQDSVSIGRLKPAFVDPMTPIEAAKRAPRGRPPTGVETISGRLHSDPRNAILPVNGCWRG